MASSRPGKRVRKIRWLLCVIVGILLAVVLNWYLSPASPPKSVILDIPVRHVDFDNVPLSDVLKVLHERTGAQLDVDWTAMGNLGMNEDTPVNLHIESASLGAILKTLLIARASSHDGVVFDVDATRVHVTSSYEQSRVVRVYDVGNIVEAEWAKQERNPMDTWRAIGKNAVNIPASRKECADNLAAIIAGTVAPDYWGKFVTSPCRMDVSEKYLVVTHGREKQKEIAGLIAEFQRADALRPAAAVPATQPSDVAAADPILNVRIPSVRIQDISARRAFLQLAGLSHENIIVRVETFSFSRSLAERPITLQLQDATLRQALEAVIKQTEFGPSVSKLSFSVIDHIVVVAADGHFEPPPVTVAYKIRDLIAKCRRAGDSPRSAESRIHDVLTRQVAPESWEDSGGSIGQAREFGGILLVTQRPGEQAQIGKVLEKLRGGEGERLLFPPEVVEPKSGMRP